MRKKKLTLNKLERQHPPWIFEYRNVKEPEDVAEESDAEDFDVAELGDELGGEKVGENLGDVVDHGGEAEEGGCAPEVLF